MMADLLGDGAAATEDHQALVCRLLAEAMARSPLDRVAIAARMAEITGEAVTADQLNKWTAPTQRQRFPLDLYPAFLAACCVEARLTRQILEPFGFLVIDSGKTVSERLGFLTWAAALMAAHRDEEARASVAATPLFREPGA